MKAFRFMHAADLHLDSPYKGLSGLPAVIVDRLRGSSFAALTRMVTLAIEQRVDFVIVSGDVYDLADRSLRAQLRFQQAAKLLADHHIPLLVIHGNHDPLQSERASLAWPESVVFFGGDAVETVTITDRTGDKLATVSGVSYKKAATTDNWAIRFPKPEPGLYAIAMLHTNVDGDAGHDNYAPCTKEQLLQAGYQYWALGHIHSRHVLHEAPYIVYPGNIQGRNSKETGAKGCYIVDVDEQGHSKLTFHETADVRWELREIAITNMSTEQELKDGIEADLAELAAEWPDQSIVVRLVLTGRGPLHRSLHRGTMLAELIDELRREQAAIAELGGKKSAFVWIESCQLQTGAELEWDRLLVQESFIGDLLRLAEHIGDNEDVFAQFCSEALAPLLANPKAAKLVQEMSTARLREWLAAARQLAVEELLEEEGRLSS